MSRIQIVNRALWWADPGEYRPYPSHLILFCKTAGCEQLPTEAEAQKGLTLDNGVYIGGKLKHWCGIFACSVLKESGVDVRWTLNGGRMMGSGVTYQAGNKNMQPGDVAIVQKTSAGNKSDQHHHFIIISVNGNVAETVDGNTAPRNMIRHLKTRKLNTGTLSTSIYGYYRIK
jgi:hypothetical protein